MNSKETLEKAFANITREVGNPYSWDWIQPVRGVKYYYLTVMRYFTR